MKDKLKNILKGKIVIMGVGNPLRGDDSLGPILIEKLIPYVQEDRQMVCIDAGSSPESYTGKIIKENPDTVLIVDAVHLGLAPGEYDILKPSEIINSGFTTHDISPRMFLDYLKKYTTADIYLLGVQPENVKLGNEMTMSVKKSLNEITESIKNARITFN